MADEGGVVGYADGIGVKYTTKWGLQMAGMNLGTHSRNITQAASQNKNKPENTP